MRKLVLFVAFALAAFAQRHKPVEVVDAGKPEGKLMQQVMQEQDPARKIALADQLAGEYPKAEGTAWVLEQVQQFYAKANDPDKVIASGDKLLAVDPEDPEAALQCLKAAEAKKDAALIKKYGVATSTNARKIASAPQPGDAAAAKTWQQQVDYAKQVAVYADYALYRAALESRDPKLTIELGEAMLQTNPNGDYSTKVRQPLFVAYRQAGANDKALALAQQVLATDQTDEDMLLVVADHYLQTKKEPEKVHTYSAKAAEVMAAKGKPEGVADTDWTSRRNQVIGLAHYMNGKQYSVENKYAQADQELKKALPMVEASPALAALKPEVLFLLGLSDYKLASASPEMAQESAHYFRACAAIKSPFQATAATNLKRIMTEYHGIK